MSIVRGACFAVAVACLVPAGAASSAGAESPRQNVVQSQRYDRMLETNRSFRKARMRKECGPITDTQLRAECLASFSLGEPSVGSSGAGRSYGSGAGR